jgi:hypothetical protein
LGSSSCIDFIPGFPSNIHTRVSFCIANVPSPVLASSVRLKWDPHCYLHL